jgi:hypothetical protein
MGVLVDDTVYEADVTVRFALKRSMAETVRAKIVEMSYGRDIPEIVGERYDYR